LFTARICKNEIKTKNFRKRNGITRPVKVKVNYNLLHVYIYLYKNPTQNLRPKTVIAAVIIPILHYSHSTSRWLPRQPRNAAAFNFDS